MLLRAATYSTFASPRRWNAFFMSTAPATFWSLAMRCRIWWRRTSISCDQSRQRMQEMGFFQPANFGPVWFQINEPKAQDFARLQELSFRHAICGHGRLCAIRPRRHTRRGSGACLGPDKREATMRVAYVSSNTSAWIEKFAPASVHAATGSHPEPRASARKESSVYL